MSNWGTGRFLYFPVKESRSMIRNLFLYLLLLSVLGCGGRGESQLVSSSSGPGGSSNLLYGKVLLDEPFPNASIEFLNERGEVIAGAESTDLSGNFISPLPLPDGATVVRASGTPFGFSEQVSFHADLDGWSGSILAITPLTDLVNRLRRSSPGISHEQARELVRKHLGLSPEHNLIYGLGRGERWSGFHAREFMEDHRSSLGLPDQIVTEILTPVSEQAEAGEPLPPPPPPYQPPDSGFAWKQFGEQLAVSAVTGVVDYFTEGFGGALAGSLAGGIVNALTGGDLTSNPLLSALGVISQQVVALAQEVQSVERNLVRAIAQSDFDQLLVDILPIEASIMSLQSGFTILAQTQHPGLLHQRLSTFLQDLNNAPLDQDLASLHTFLLGEQTQEGVIQRFSGFNGLGGQYLRNARRTSEKPTAVATIEPTLAFFSKYGSVQTQGVTLLVNKFLSRFPPEPPQASGAYETYCQRLTSQRALVPASFLSTDEIIVDRIHGLVWYYQLQDSRRFIDAWNYRQVSEIQGYPLWTFANVGEIQTLFSEGRRISDLVNLGFDFLGVKDDDCDIWIFDERFKEEYGDDPPDAAYRVGDGAVYAKDQEDQDEHGDTSYALLMLNTNQLLESHPELFVTAGEVQNFRLGQGKPDGVRAIQLQAFADFALGDRVLKDVEVTERVLWTVDDPTIARVVNYPVAGLLPLEASQSSNTVSGFADAPGLVVFLKHGKVVVTASIVDVHSGATMSATVEAAFFPSQDELTSVLLSLESQQIESEDIPQNAHLRASLWGYYANGTQQTFKSGTKIEWQVVPHTEDLHFNDLDDGTFELKFQEVPTQSPFTVRAIIDGITSNPVTLFVDLP